MKVRDAQCSQLTLQCENYVLLNFLLMLAWSTSNIALLTAKHTFCAYKIILCTNMSIHRHCVCYVVLLRANGADVTAHCIYNVIAHNSNTSISCSSYEVV